MHPKYLSLPFLCILLLDITAAHQIPYSFRNHKRQNEPGDADLQVNIHPEAAKALSAFLKLDTTLDSCGVDLGPSPMQQPGEPDAPKIDQRANPMQDAGHPFYDLQRFIGKTAPPEDALKCSKIRDKFVYWEAAKSAIGDFCRDGARLQSIVATAEELKNGKVINAYYNSGVYNEMDLRITWYQNDRIDEDGCVQFSNNIVDGCDKDENDKHGGFYTYKKSQCE